MLEDDRVYYISLRYDALYCKTMEVTAATSSEACRFAIEHADDDDNWQDTCLSSSHWIANVDNDSDSVPEEFTEPAVRAGGAIIIAHRLRDALKSLVDVCEKDPRTRTAVGHQIASAKAVLETTPERIVVE